MKRIFTLLALVTFATIGYSQSPTKTLTGNITANRTLDRDTIYYLDGFVYVKNNTTFTIESGTVIKGVSGERSTLIITRGSKIMANGTANSPIVFTSEEDAGFRAPGDWGGIIILGKGIINVPSDCSTCPGTAIAAGEPGVQNAIEGDIDNANGDGLYGGTDPNDNSGVLSYVRIEYAGVIITSGNEINGLTFGGVGRGTTVDHVQVSYANDDSYEFFGGQVNTKHLISLGAIDDDFDTDFGFSGKNQWGVAQRDSNNYDTGSGPTTNGFESDNNATGTIANPRTSAVFCNFTVVGPLANGTPLAQSNSFQNGARIRRSSQISIMNSVIMGFPTGILIDGNNCNLSYLGDTLDLQNNISAGATVSDIRSSVAISDAAVKAKFELESDTLNSTAGILVSPFAYGTADFFPVANGPAASGAAFTDTVVTNAFFTPVTYKGAFGKNAFGMNDHWDWCWSNWNPQNTNYDNGAINNASSVVANFTANGVQNVVTFTNTSTDGVEYAWSFGDGQYSYDANPVHTYPNNDASYTVIMIAVQPCGMDTVTQQINVITGIKEYANVLGVTVYPNPAQDLANIIFTMPTSDVVAVTVYDVTGALVSNQAYGKMVAGKQNIQINTSALQTGMYFVRMQAGTTTQTIRLAVTK